MSNNLIGYLVQLLLAIGVVLLAYALIRTSLRDLLDQLLKLPAGTTFYQRSLLVILLFGALGQAVGHKFELKPDSAFMEYVWEVAAALGSVLETTFWFFIVYLVQMTILAAVLRRKHEQ